MGPITVILIIVFGFVALLLIALVLLQDEQSDGLGGIFGGSGGSQIGNRKGNILTRTTTVLGGLFLVVCFGLALINHHGGTKTDDIEAAGLKQQAATQSVDWWSNKPEEATALPAAAVPEQTALPADAASPIPTPAPVKSGN